MFLWVHSHMSMLACSICQSEYRCHFIRANFVGNTPSNSYAVHCMKKMHRYTNAHRVRAISHIQHFHLSICCSKHFSLPRTFFLFLLHSLHPLFTQCPPCCASVCLNDCVCVCVGKRKGEESVFFLIALLESHTEKNPIVS